MQGAAELLPVSSSAHVIVAEKLMGLDPTSPAMVFLLVMLHTGHDVRRHRLFLAELAEYLLFFPFRFHQLFHQRGLHRHRVHRVIGLVLKKVIEKIFLHGAHGGCGEVETLFGNTLLITGALAAVGVFIIIAGMAKEKHGRSEIKFPQSFAIGVIQGICLPFRGFSRSGATISMALLSGLPRLKAEQFSFALAVILTPVVIAMEGKRLLEANKAGAHLPIHELMTPGLAGMGVAFVAGLLALVVLSKRPGRRPVEALWILLLGGCGHRFVPPFPFRDLKAVCRMRVAFPEGCPIFRRSMRLTVLCAFALIASSLSVEAEEYAVVRAADGFQLPVGPNGTGSGYYIARGVRPNGHLGEDWNGLGGGDTDLGDPVYAVANGYVTFARNYHVGWGNVVILRHAYYEGSELKYCDSLYGHLLDFSVQEGEQVHRGQQIGRIGNNFGMYEAHLHFEMRKNLQIGMFRSSFARDFTNYYVPNEFIAEHRACPHPNSMVKCPINTYPAVPPPVIAGPQVESPIIPLPHAGSAPTFAKVNPLPPQGSSGLAAALLAAPRVVTATPPPAAPSVVIHESKHSSEVVVAPTPTPAPRPGRQGPEILQRRPSFPHSSALFIADRHKNAVAAVTPAPGASSPKVTFADHSVEEASSTPAPTAGKHFKTGVSKTSANPTALAEVAPTPPEKDKPAKPTPAAEASASAPAPSPTSKHSKSVASATPTPKSSSAHSKPLVAVSPPVAEKRNQKRPRLSPTLPIRLPPSPPARRRRHTNRRKSRRPPETSKCLPRLRLCRRPHRIRGIPRLSSAPATAIKSTATRTCGRRAIEFSRDFRGPAGTQSCPPAPANWLR